MRKRDLERELELVREFSAPKRELEQYRTPPGVAADLLWEANADGDIAGKKFVDLGCGTGMFARGAQLLGAAHVLGVDCDPEVLADAAKCAPGAEFVEARLEDWTPSWADTVMMNPPFGAQHKHADRIFYEKALSTGAKAIWFLAQPTTEKYLAAMAKEAGKELEKIQEWSYPLPATMEHHFDAVRQMRVGGYRLS